MSEPWASRLRRLNAVRPASPLWWRIPTWLVLTAFTVSQAHGVDARIAAGATMTLAWVALQFVEADDRRVARFAVVLTTAASVAACTLAHGGLAEIPLVVAASRAPHSFDGVALRGFVVLDTITFAVTIAVIADSPSGLLAGLAIPFFIQRAVEHQELVRERDRARALLAEVQRGRESETHAAALQERGRIAREMHDVLAHTLAGLSVQLQAIRAVAAREDVGKAVLDPLDRAASLAREGLSEARAAVSTLRDPVGLGLDALPALVERHPGVTRLEVDGTPGEVGAEAGHAVYRAVQESLTNAARYAPGAPVEVAVRWQSARLVATVTDPGPPPGRESVGGQGTGLGLAGMAERITAVSGTLHSGPGPDGRGWRVEICVPTAPARGNVEP